MVAELGNWRGRRPSSEEWERLSQCACPACKQCGLEGLKASGIDGSCNRATHNLWTLLEEARLIREHLAARTYAQWYKEHLVNSVYRPLVDKLLEMMSQERNSENTRPATISATKAKPVSQPISPIYGC